MNTEYSDLVAAFTKETAGIIRQYFDSEAEATLKPEWVKTALRQREEYDVDGEWYIMILAAAARRWLQEVET